jgi:ribosome-associated protein
MNLETLQNTVIHALENVKGREIEILETGHLTPLFERMIIASGDSNRQARALARQVADKVREAGGEVLSVEGEDGGEWVLIDLGDLIVHVMQPETRRYYNLEELWRDAPNAALLASAARQDETANEEPLLAKRPATATATGWHATRKAQKPAAQSTRRVSWART